MSSSDRKNGRPFLPVAKISGPAVHVIDIGPRLPDYSDLEIPAEIKQMVSMITGSPFHSLMGPPLSMANLLPGPDTPESDTINSPKHYRSESGIEAIDVIEAWELDFNLGNVVKYICRDGLKEDPTNYLSNLEKALWYLQREVDNRRAKLR